MQDLIDIPAAGTIGVLGGTFDPPHLGHAAIGREFLRQGMADRLLYVPAAVPPHKENSAVSSFEHRWNMLSLALGGEDRTALSDIERLRAPSPSFTLTTMRELSEYLPGNRLAFIVGGDSLLDMRNWHDADELASRWDVLVYPRPGSPINRKKLAAAWGAETAARLLRFVLPAAPLLDISSTRIRKLRAAAQPFEHLLAPPVAKYIRDNNLYVEVAKNQASGKNTQA